MIGFLNKCITLLQRELSSTESGGGKRQHLLKELTDRRRRIEGGMRSPIPPRPPARGLSTSPSISPRDFTSTVATPSKVCLSLFIFKIYFFALPFECGIVSSSFILLNFFKIVMRPNSCFLHNSCIMPNFCISSNFRFQWFRI